MSNRQSTIDNRQSRRGFTLIEMLVVIGILASLITLVLVGYVKVRRTANKTATAFQIQTVSTAIDAYYADFDVYPPIATTVAGVPIDNTGFAALGTSVVGAGGKLPGALDGAYSASVDYGVGSHVDSGGIYYLCINRSGATPVPAPPNATYWYAGWNGADGLDGPGFKMVRAAGTDNTMMTGDDVVTGRTYGPYLRDGVRTRGFSVLDRNGNALLYYPLTGRRPDIRKATVPLPEPFVGTTNASMINANYNKLLTLSDLRKLAGDTNANGVIDNGEVPAFDGKYIVWSAGEDGNYGVGTDGKSDDVTNFDLPAGLRR